MGDIVWMASYPKSGNTWVRAFLTNYLDDAQGPASIDRLVGLHAASRRLFDEIAGVEASTLTADEVAAARPNVYRALARESGSTVFMKAHDAFCRHGAEMLFPSDVSRLACYIVRNPLDVAVSLAAHRGCSLEDATDQMNSGYVLARSGRELQDQLEQPLHTWSGHVGSWVDQADIPLHVIRYEDLLSDPDAAFGAMIRRLGIDLDRLRLANAIARSTFDVLRRQEEESGFSERLSRTSPFFREGCSGRGAHVLSPALVDRIVSVHAPMMHRFGYASSREML